MSRRLIILLALPALTLVAWLVAAQLPRWTAPQPAWLPAETPGVCAAVASLAVYNATRTDPNTGIGRASASANVAPLVSDYYGTAPLAVSEPLAVQASLPGRERGGYFLLTARLTNDALPKTAILYLDAATGDLRALITATDDPALNCDFDLRGALVAALRSPPPLLLAAYAVIVAGVLAVRTLRGRFR